MANEKTQDGITTAELMIGGIEQIKTLADNVLKNKDNPQARDEFIKQLADDVMKLPVEEINKRGMQLDAILSTVQVLLLMYAALYHAAKAKESVVGNALAGRRASDKNEVPLS